MKKLLVLLIVVLLESCDIAFDTCDYPVYSHQVYSHYYYYEGPMFPPPYYRPVGPPMYHHIDGGRTFGGHIF